MPITKAQALKYVQSRLEDEEDSPEAQKEKFLKNKHTIRISLTAIVCLILIAYLTAVLHRNYTK